MSNKVAYIYGCSHAAGSEIEGDQVTESQYNMANSFPVQLAKLLGYHPVNQSKPGSSNDYIYRKISELNTADSSDLIIAVWTGIERIEIFDEVSDLWINFSRGMAFTPKYINSTHREFYRLYERLMCDAEGYRGKMNKIKNIVAANILAKSKNIPILNINAFHPVELPAASSVSWALSNVSFMDWALKHQFSHTDWYHFRLDAHTAFANELYEDIKESGILQ